MGEAVPSRPVTFSMKKKDPKSGYQVATGPKRATGPDKPEFWTPKLRLLVHTLRGVRRYGTEWTIRLQHDGTREVVNLKTSDKAQAAKDAVDVYHQLKANGWDAVRAVHKPESQETLPPGAVWTMGDVLKAARARSDLAPTTTRDYEDGLRTIASQVAGMPSGRSLGSKQLPAWRERVDKLPISIIDKVSVAEWRNGYIKDAGKDPLRRLSAQRSSATYIRNARSLFLAEGMPDNPFLGVKLKNPPSDKYTSTVNAKELWAAAHNELRAKRSQLYLGLLLALWAGLRKKEADLLLWEQVDIEGSTIQIRTTRFFKPKTKHSTRPIHLKPEIMADLVSLRKKGVFVMTGGVPKVGSVYRHYRCRATWVDLKEWLRSHGIDDVKAIHYLRKEAGSLMNAAFGPLDTMLFLGHGDIRTTTDIYIESRGRREVTL